MKFYLTIGYDQSHADWFATLSVQCRSLAKYRFCVFLIERTICSTVGKNMWRFEGSCMVYIYVMCLDLPYAGI